MDSGSPDIFLRKYSETNPLVFLFTILIVKIAFEYVVFLSLLDGSCMTYLTYSHTYDVNVNHYFSSELSVM